MLSRGRGSYFICFVVLIGCSDSTCSRKRPTATVPKKIEETCSRCHMFPAANWLPRARWQKIIPEMAGMLVPEGVKALTKAEVEAALAWYTSTAPEALRALPPTPALSARLGGFRIEQYTPRGLDKQGIPAVANVNIVALGESEQRELLISEMRFRSVFRLKLGSGPADMHPLGDLIMKLNYPVHTALGDVNGDGRRDVLVASLGGMNPGNETRGSVSVLLGSDAHASGFGHRVVAENLGRVTDARAVDFDGDGDEDIVVAAFGWRGPGRLLLLESLDRSRLRYKQIELDDRDGYIHLEPMDVDRDGRMDFVGLLSQHHEQVVWFHNQGSLRFTRRVLHQAPHPAWGYSGMQSVDLDGDGDLDLLLSNGDALDDHLLKPYHGIAWLENDGKVGFTHHHLATMPGCQRAVARDVDGDGDLDVVAVSFLPQLPPSEWKKHDLASVLWLERDGDVWRQHVLEKHRSIHPTVDVGDLNGDGKAEIVVGNYVFIAEGGATRTPADFVTVFVAR